MAKKIVFTRNRDTIYDFLSRARKFHATASSVVEIEVGALMDALARRRESGRPVSFLAALVKSTGMVMDRYPRLNHHLFHGLVRKFEVDFEEIVCTLIVLRKHERELILLPVNIEAPHQRDIDDLEAEIHHHRTTPVAELPQFQGIQKMKKMPRAAMHAFSFLCRSNPSFYRKFFGTYGISPLGLQENDGGLIEERAGFATNIFANTCTAFLPAGVADHPRVEDGEIVIRKLFTMTIAVDHYLVDGHDGFMAMRYLTKLLGAPERLGL